MQKMASIEENPSMIQMTSNATDDLVHRISPNNNITDAVFSVLQNIVSLTCTAVKDYSATSDAGCINKSSNASQTGLDNNFFNLPSLASAQNFAISAAVLDNGALPVTKSTVDRPMLTAPSNNFIDISLNNAMYNSPFIPGRVEAFNSPEACAAMTIRRKFQSRGRPKKNQPQNYKCNVATQIYKRNVATQIYSADQSFFEANKYTENQIQSFKENFKSFPRSISISGRRLVDVSHFISQLKSVNKHSEYGCNLNDVFVKKETIKGLFTSYTLKCSVCKFETEISSDDTYKANSFNYYTFTSILLENKTVEKIHKLFSMLELPLAAYTDIIQEYGEIQKQKKKKKGGKFYRLKSRANRVLKVRIQAKKNNTQGNRLAKNRKQAKENLKKNMEKSEKIVLSDADESLDEKMDLDNNWLVKDELEIEEDVSDSDSESETILPLDTQSANDNEHATGQEKIAIKQEIDSELHCNGVTNSITTKEASNKKGSIENDKKFNVVVSQQPIKMETCEDANQGAEMITIKKEISFYDDDEEFPNSPISETQISDQKSLTDKDKQPNEKASQQKQGEAHENIAVYNQEKVNFHKSKAIDKITEDSENQTHHNNKLFASESKKLRVMNKTDLRSHTDSNNLHKRTDIIREKEKVVANQKLIKLDNRETKENPVESMHIDKFNNQSSVVEQITVRATSTVDSPTLIAQSNNFIDISLNNTMYNSPVIIGSVEIFDSPEACAAAMAVTKNFRSRGRPKKKKISESNFKSNVTAASIADGANVVAAATEKSLVHLEPVQHKSKSRRNDDLLVHQKAKDQGAIMKMNSLPRNLSENSVSNVPVFAVKRKAGAILKQSKQDTMYKSSLPKIPVSAVGMEVETSLAKDTIAADNSCFNKSSTVVSSVSSPIEVIDISDDSIDEKNVEQIDPASQDSSNSFTPSKRFKSINNQVNSAFLSHHDETVNSTDGEVPPSVPPCLPVSQEVNQFANSNSPVIGMPVSILPTNTVNIVQVPSTSFTSPFQVPQYFLPLQTIPQYWISTPPVSATPSGTETENVTREKIIGLSRM